ncbi:unnamed protein product [Effrenium voratum]|nr:unnamed protein product [Effrenium voratum]CAJ1425724.1 unnamed protein product [Effrenium voratum]
MSCLLVLILGTQVVRLAESLLQADCSSNAFDAPTPPVADPMQHNGQALRDACFDKTASHVFVIGDWGGVQYAEGMPIMPADHRSHLFPKRVRAFVNGVDNCAQQRVAAQMFNWSLAYPPDYIINVGDNFYWGGANSSCESNALVEGFRWHQWGPIFEDMYRGGGLDGKQWLGVLGNHDYGGFLFTSGWHETIFYTWAAGSSGRWLTPAQYWQVKARYTDFSVDYYFVDTNVHNAWPSGHESSHNICSDMHNSEGAWCPITGPYSVETCYSWFKTLWELQTRWLDQRLSLSAADWQIVVSHFPPEYNVEYWRTLGARYGIDLLISGHRHFQQIIQKDEVVRDAISFPFTIIISGGGGGITADRKPDLFGHDDAYGFMDLFLTKHKISIKAISHTGALRKEVDIPRQMGAAIV